VNADTYPPAPVLERPTLRAAATTCRACDISEHALTAHPSSILRVRGEAERASATQAFVDDLAMVTQWLPSA
jgi:hypothetical protein